MRINAFPVRLSSSLLLFLIPLASPLISQNKGDCAKPPKLIFQPKLSPEQMARINSSSLQGRAAVLINERGDVTAAKVISAKPKEGAEVLYDAVTLAKFAPRPGCGPLKLQFIFNLSNK